MFKKDKYATARLVLSSGDGDERPDCTLSIAGFGYSLEIKLPPIIKPKATKVFPKWDDATIKRLGRDYYYDYARKEYGFTLFEGHVSIPYGIQTDSSDTEKRYGFFLPWTQNTFIRRTLFNADGTFYANFPAGKGRFGNGEWDKEYAATKTVKKIHFSFLDYDLEEITASCFIEEREWHRGEKWCSWLKYLTKPMVSKNLDLQFSSEVGKRKNDWKGGTLGHGITMLPDEKPIDAFMRYCIKANLKFVGITVAPPQKEYVKPEEPCKVNSDAQIN